MEAGRRARSDDAKAHRRRVILEAAMEIYRESSFEGFSMAQLARRVGLAKGTLYLYFNTKEEVFLALLEDELTGWFDTIDNGLEQGIDVEGFLELIGRALAERPEMLRLMGQLHTVLESNVGYERALEFRQRLLERTMHTGMLLEACFRFLGRGEGVKLLVKIHALVIGFQHLSTPAPVVERVLETAGMGVFRVEFPQDLISTLRELIQGIQKSVRRGERVAWQVIL